MILKSINLKTFKCFEDYSVSFDKINLLSGAIGIGKSTILEGLIFALYGYYSGVLADLPTRDKSKSCTAMVIIEDNGHIIEIIRDYPLKLTIKEDGKTLKMSTSEGNTYLIDRFGSRQDFFQFRIVDAYSKETNLLEQGNVVFKKILFAGTDEKFNEVRNNLNIIKLEREKLNKDSVVVYKHYPSEKRLNTLITNLVDINNSLVIANSNIATIEKELREDELKLSRNESRHGEIQRIVGEYCKQIENIDTIRSSYDSSLQTVETRIKTLEKDIENFKKQLEEIDKQSDTIKTTAICYVCKQPLNQHTAEDIMKEKITKKEELSLNIKRYKHDIEITQENIKTLKENIMIERKKRADELAKELENIRNEDIELCHDIPRLLNDIQNTKEIIIQNKESKDKLLLRKERLQVLIIKLEARLQQKQYIYTEKDIIVVKKAIEELDKLSSVYLVSTVQSLEPIINSILEKIGFQITFDVDIKGKFNIILSKEDIQYKYSDLSCGQRLILQIALKLSLLLQQSKTGIILSDEGLSALENNNLEDIINLFKELQFQLVFVLHRASIEDTEINTIRLGEQHDTI